MMLILLMQSTLMQHYLEVTCLLDTWTFIQAMLENTDCLNLDMIWLMI